MRKIAGDVFLNRAEAISYLLHAYNVKLCMTRWSNHSVAFSLENEEGVRRRKRVRTYSTKGSKIARVNKSDLDGFFD